MPSLHPYRKTDLPELAQIPRIGTYGKFRMPLNGYLDLSDITEVNTPAEKASRHKLIKGDVLMTEGGDFDKLGRGYVWEDQIKDCLHENHIFAVRPNQSYLDSYFLAALLTSSHDKTTSPVHHNKQRTWRLLMLQN